jgi:hypothetical protein
MNEENKTQSKLSELLKSSIQEKVENIAPNFRKKNKLSDEQIEKIINTIRITLDIDANKAIVGMILLFLQGASSAGAPISMAIELGEGKIITKRNVLDACTAVTGHQYIRRIAETLASEIGKFAFNNKLSGELAGRINNRLKAETGENLTEIEMAYCSSFSQAIPNLNEITSERLAKLLAEDYQKRFEIKKKSNKAELQQFEAKYKNRGKSNSKRK